MNLQEYWSGLQQREQRVLMAGGVVLLLTMIYALIIDPMSNELDRLERSVTLLQEDLVWMQQSAAEVKKLRASGARPGTHAGGQSLMSAIDSTARKHGLAKALKQISPSGGKVRVRLEGAGFDAMLSWLADLGKAKNAPVSSLNIERLPASGMVNATVVLGNG